MYHIGVKTGFFVRKIKVVDHEFGQVLSYATPNRIAVTIPASAIKKFVVYADYWDHQKELEARGRRSEVQMQIDYWKQAAESEQREKAELVAQVQQLVAEKTEARQPQAAVPVMQIPMNRQLSADELMANEAARRAMERMNGIVQPNAPVRNS